MQGKLRLHEDIAGAAGTGDFCACGMTVARVVIQPAVAQADIAMVVAGLEKPHAVQTEG